MSLRTALATSSQVEFLKAMLVLFHRLGASEILADGVFDRDVSVEEVPLDHGKPRFVTVVFQALVLLQNHFVWKDGVNAVVHVGVVVDSVGNLVRVTCC